MSRMDVHHDKDTSIVTASFELPGLWKEGVTIDVHNDILTVSGAGESESASERSQDGHAIREPERQYGKSRFRGLCLRWHLRE
jgi:HSP20 family protein